MATINNSQAIQRILDDAGIQTAIDEVPKQLARSVVPVLISNPKPSTYKVIKNAYNTTQSATVLYTTPSDKDFYLTGIWFSNNSDVACDNTSMIINVVPENGVSTSILQIYKPSVTVYVESFPYSFSKPIKLERGSTILFTNSFTAGSSVTSISLTGYIV